jgi:uncharacterized protein (DUF1778 family)
MGTTKLVPKTIMKRPSPLSVRISQAEKNTLTEAAKQLRTSRNDVVLRACRTMVLELKSEKTIAAIQ